MRNNECDCNSYATGIVKIEINDSNIELNCTICGGLIGWLVE